LDVDAKNLLIPYNCQFIISKSVSNGTYDLIEVYSVKNETFFTELHQKNAKFLPNEFLYSRRMDLNGTALEMNTLFIYLFIYLFTNTTALQ
jgi:hypothetical protein